MKDAAQVGVYRTDDPRLGELLVGAGCVECSGGGECAPLLERWSVPRCRECRGCLANLTTRCDRTNATCICREAATPCQALLLPGAHITPAH